MFENRAMKRIFGPKKEEVRGGGEEYIMRSFIICMPRQGRQLKEHEMAVELSTHWSELKCI
jgi:hypothetical protein